MTGQFAGRWDRVRYLIGRRFLRKRGIICQILEVLRLTAEKFDSGHQFGTNDFHVTYPSLPKMCGWSSITFRNATNDFRGSSFNAIVSRPAALGFCQTQIGPLLFQFYWVPIPADKHPYSQIVPTRLSDIGSKPIIRERCARVSRRLPRPSSDVLIHGEHVRGYTHTIPCTSGGRTVNPTLPFGDRTSLADRRV